MSLPCEFDSFRRESHWMNFFETASRSWNRIVVTPWICIKFQTSLMHEKVILLSCMHSLVLVLICLQFPYLPVYNAHFCFVKLTFKFAMRIILGSHCLPKFSLAYRKQKLHTSWFWITLIKKLLMKSVWFRSLKKLNKTSHCISCHQNVNIATKLTTTKRQSYTVCEKLRIIELCWPAVEMVPS